MKTIDRHVLDSFLAAFVLTLLILSFVLTMGALSQIVRCIVAGVSVLPVCQFAAVGFHETLQWSVPLSLLFTSVFVFSRMSADNELMALKTCGFDILRIIRVPLLISLVLAVVSLFFNFEIQPREHLLRGGLRRQLLAEAAMKTIVPGRVVNIFPRFKFIFDAREGDEFVGFRAWERTDAETERMVRAERVTALLQGDDLVLTLKKATADPLDAQGRYFATAGSFCYVLQGMSGKAHPRRGCRDMRFLEIWRHLLTYREKMKQAHRKELSLKVVRLVERELSFTRLTFSLRILYAAATVVFTIVGIGIGMSVRRRHSLIGFLVALVVAVGYYLPAILVKKMENHPDWRPEFLVWLPMLIFAVVGIGLIRRFR